MNQMETTSFAIRAHARHIHMSPRKARLVVDLVRGKGAEEALAILRFSPHAASQPLHKLLTSALANAEENYGLGQDELFVAEIWADEAPTQKRGRFAARGRWKPLRKRSCHLSVALREIEPGSEAPRPKKQAEGDKE
jgi:large subunit ribosomal protein L22